MPHIIEASVNPPRQTTRKLRLPKREAIQPTGAVMIAAATMYDVRTQVI